MGRIGKRMVLMSATNSFPTEQIVESGVEMSAPALIKSIGIMQRMIALLVPANQRSYLSPNQCYKTYNLIENRKPSRSSILSTLDASFSSAKSFIDQSHHYSDNRSTSSFLEPIVNLGCVNSLAATATNADGIKDKRRIY